MDQLEFFRYVIGILHGSGLRVYGRRKPELDMAYLMEWAAKLHVVRSGQRHNRGVRRACGSGGRHER